jgi:hypothetical protein
VNETVEKSESECSNHNELEKPYPEFFSQYAKDKSTTIGQSAEPKYYGSSGMWAVIAIHSNDVDENDPGLLLAIVELRHFDTFHPQQHLHDNIGGGVKHQAQGYR